MNTYTGPGELVPESGDAILVQLHLQFTTDGWGGLLSAPGDDLPMCVHAAFNRRLPLVVRVAGAEVVVHVGFISRSGRAEIRGEGAAPWCLGTY